ncbi:MAG TPA: hypothetical protein VK034_17075 [Enhygromyxa sp.]|nr:hypothetical protein [Enhygromyxa sp.]
MRGSRLTTMLALACIAMVACEQKDVERRPDLEAAAAAALGEGKDDKTKELEAKAAEERKRKFEERKAKEAEQQAKLDTIAAAVVKAPDKPSKNLVAACDALIVIYEEWIKAVYFDDDGFQLNFFDSKSKNLGEVKGKCAKLDSVAATDCMIEVIRAVSAEDFSEADRKLIQAQPEYLFGKCVDQFAPEKKQ